MPPEGSAGHRENSRDQATERAIEDAVALWIDRLIEGLVSLRS